MPTSCRECYHYQPNGLGQGECHRYPPGVVPMGAGQMAAIWPVVRHDAFCGEWSAEVVTVAEVVNDAS